MTLTLEPGTPVENLMGGNGNDTLIGNAASNLLTAGTGNDTLIGGGGTDTYVFPSDPGNDTIRGTIAGAADPTPTIVVNGSVSLLPGSTPGTMEIMAQNDSIITFADPATSLTIAANAVNVAGLDSALKARLSFMGGTYTIDGKIDAGSGGLSVNASNININSKITTTGDITLTANAYGGIFVPGLIQQAGAGPQISSITLGPNAQLSGANVTLSGDANDSMTNLPTHVSDVLELLGSFRPFFGLADVLTQSTITVAGGASITAEQNVSITAESDATASLTTVSPAVIAGSWARAQAYATIDVGSGASITAPDGAVTISTITTNTISVKNYELSLPYVYGIDLAVAATQSYSQAHTTIEPGAVITAGGPQGNVTISATNKKSVSSTVSDGDGSDRLGVAVGVNLSTTDAEASVGGTIVAAGKVNVTASSTTAANSTSVDSVIGDSLYFPVIESLKVGRLPTGAYTPIANGVSDLITKFKNLVSQTLKGQTAQQTAADIQADQVQSQKVGIAAAVGFASSRNQAIASVASTGQIDAGGDINVDSTVADELQTSVISEVNQYTDPNVNPNDPNDPRSKLGNVARTKQNAAAMGVAVSLFTNISQAFIAPGATVNTFGALNVHADTELPFTTFNWNQFLNSNSIGSDIAQGVEYLIGSVLNENLGIQNAFSTWAQAASDAQNYGLALSTDVLLIQNNTDAYIGSARGSTRTRLITRSPRTSRSWRRRTPSL